jgi:hypothetical protein
MDDQRRAWLEHPLTRELLEKVKELRGHALLELEDTAANGDLHSDDVAVECSRKASAAYAYRVVAESMKEGWQ